MFYLPRDIDYAIRALIHAAQKQGKKPQIISVEEIAKEQQLPHALLRRILQMLAKAGFFQSRKGKGGGFILIKDPSNITILEIINLFSAVQEKCKVSGKTCPRIPQCKLRNHLFAINKLISNHMKYLTIAALI